MLERLEGEKNWGKCE